MRLRESRRLKTLKAMIAICLAKVIQSNISAISRLKSQCQNGVESRKKSSTKRQTRKRYVSLKNGLLIATSGERKFLVKQGKLGRINDMGTKKQAQIIVRLAHLITNRSERLSNQESLSASVSIKLTQEIKTYCFLIRVFQEN